MNIQIKQIPSSDWEKYKNLRLEGLLESPEAFGGTYEEEASRNEASWREWLDNSYIVGAYNADNLVGCMTILRNTSARTMHASHMYGVYVSKSFRGIGVAKKLLENSIEYSKETGIEIIYLNVTTTQLPAIELYKSFGFKEYGLMKKSLYLDGKYLDQVCMYLEV